jgi:DNA-directed RNA polymerase subunit F
MAGNVRVVLKSVFDDKGIKQAQDAFGKVGSAIGATLAAAGAATVAAGVAIAQFGNKSLTAASNLSESLNAVNVAYGAASASVAQLGEDAATRLGVTQTEFNQAAVRFSAFAERVVGEGGNVTTFIDDITTRATDFASVFNIDVAEALQVFQSGLSGEAEPLKRFGINLLDSEVKAYAMANGIGEVGKQLTETQKVQARYGLLMESTAKTQGDFANTSDGLANSQRILRASFTDLQAAVGQELLPVFEEFNAALIDILPELEDALVPVFKNIAENVGPALTNMIELIADVLKEANDESTPLGKSIREAGDAFELMFDALAGGRSDLDTTTDTLGMLADGLKFIVTTLASFIAFLGTFGTALDALAKGDFATFWEWLTSDPIEFQNNMRASQDALKQTNEEFNNTADAARKLNEVNFADFRGQLGDTRQAARDFANEQRQLYNLMRGITTPTTTTTTTNTTTTTKPTGKSPAEIAREEQEKREKAAQQAFERVSKLVRDTQKKISKAQADYDKDVTRANEEYLESVTRIRQDYADKLEKIVLDSQKRLTDAFRSAVSVDIGKLFADSLDLQKEQAEDLAKGQEALAKATLKLKQEQEDLNAVLLNPKATQTQITAARRAYESAQAAVDKLGADVKKIRTTSDPVAGLVEGLRSRLQNANELIARTAALAAEGFSQTFIEQIVSTGAETGNQMAAAILASTPETRAELRRLFAAVENTSERGMNDLARTIYEQQGLATRELRELYKQTNIELQQALGDQQVEFQRALEAAAVELGEKLRDIKADFEEDVADLKGSYGGLKGVIDSVSRSMDSMIGKADQAAKAASEAAIKAANATRAAIGDITGTTPSSTDLGLGTGTTGSEGLQGFGDPLEMRRLAAIQAAGSALGQFGQGFINMVTGQRSFSKGGQVVAVSGTNERRAAELLAQGFVETFANNIDRASLDLALSLAEQVYGVDIGGISTPGQIGGNTFNITVNAGMGTDPITVGREIVDAIKRFERSSGQVFIGV